MKNSNNLDIDPNISSAEMTAYWRCQYPKISGDNLSLLLTTNEGIRKAKDFEKRFNYSLIGRAISLRAGFFLDKAIAALLTKKFDSCISFASGFSLLTYLIAKYCQKNNLNIKFIDTDLPHILHARESRINLLSNSVINKSLLLQIQTYALDLENACRSGLSLQKLFPNHQSPIFLLEGIFYFLTKNCVQWLCDEIAAYKNALVIIDYWAEGSENISRCFKGVLASLDQTIPEKINTLWSPSSSTFFADRKYFSYKDFTLQEQDKIVASNCGELPMLNDIDTFIPVHFGIAVRNTYFEDFSVFK